MKTYWQAMDSDGKVYLFCNEKPTCDDGEYYSCHSGEYTAGITFPIPLKPLQIAEVKVNENGTWRYEIERENGWYMGYCTTNGETGVFRYNKGVWYHRNGGDCIGRISNYTISPNRIPDECII